jgi:hypothetical protein
VETSQALWLVLAALLVGALLPALVQLTLAMRELRGTAARAGQAVTAAGQVVQRMDRLTARLEEGNEVEKLLGAVEGLSGALSRFQETVRLASAVGAAVAPAMAAAVRAWRGQREGEPPAEGAGGHDSPAEGEEARS